MPMQIKDELDSVYGDSASSFTTVKIFDTVASSVAKEVLGHKSRLIIRGRKTGCKYLVDSGVDVLIIPVSKDVPVNTWSRYPGIKSTIQLMKENHVWTDAKKKNKLENGPKHALDAKSAQLPVIQSLNLENTKHQKKGLV
ncbi:hypothetical protein NPIL_651771 [Nephila pilipes]|uniref:Uncharacterized protein n=1 Tax=Nephila pilipes TaxID=299642 RepID=A0A8X6N227_NEPPI|nr:hypothetical protein NPIL_651771 [Nephila pilipes]